MSRMDLQLFSLVVSFLAILSLLALCFLKKQGRFFYIVMLLGWIPGFAFYSVLVFRRDLFDALNLSGGDTSALLRAYQYIMFGTWFVFECFELLLDKLKDSKILLKLRTRGK